MAKVDAHQTDPKPVRGDSETKLQVDTFVSAGGKVHVLAGSSSDSALNKKNVSKPQHVRAAQKNVAAAQFRQVRKEILRRKSEIAKTNYALMMQNKKNDDIEKGKAESSRSLMYPIETPPQQRAEKLKGLYRRKSDTAAPAYRTRTDTNESAKSLLLPKQSRDKLQSKVIEQSDVKIPFHRRSVVHVSGGSIESGKTGTEQRKVTSNYGSVVTSQPRALVPPPRSNEMLSDNYVPSTSDALTSLGYSASGYNLSDIQEVSSINLTQIVKTGVKDFLRFLYMPFKCCNTQVSKVLYVAFFLKSFSQKILIVWALSNQLLNRVKR